MSFKEHFEMGIQNEEKPAVAPTSQICSSVNNNNGPVLFECPSKSWQCDSERA